MILSSCLGEKQNTNTTQHTDTKIHGVHMTILFPSARQVVRPKQGCLPLNIKVSDSMP